MSRKSLAIGLALSCVIILGSGKAEAGKIPSGELTPELLVTGLEGATGSTIGPSGALYVTEGAAGRISRVDPQTGEITTFASGLPKAIVGIGGAIDVAFIGTTAYVLVTLVGSDVGGSDVVGIYRVDGPDSFTVVTDIGVFALDHPPKTRFDVPTGVQYALQTYRGGFLVTDGHHNRVLRVTLDEVTDDGEVTELIAFDNIVPTGLAVSGNTVYMAEAGPIPHLPENGKVVAFGPKSLTATEVASGASLLVDVEFGRGRRLYALSQGAGSGGPPGSPALPNTGALVEVNGDGTFTVITDGLDRPTSLEFIGNTAYVVTLTGEIWKIDGVSGPPYGGLRWATGGPGTYRSAPGFSVYEERVMTNNLKSWRQTITMVGLTLGLMISPTYADSSGQPTIEGMTYGEWSARWWQWVRSIPSATNPLTASGEVEVDCTQGQDGPVLFLAGTVVGPVDRTCKNPIPQRQTLFLSPLTFMWNNDPADTEPKDLTEAQKRALLNGLISDITPEDPLVESILGVASHACNLDITVDDKSIVVDAVPIVRTQSPAFRIKVRENDVFGGTAGAVDPKAVADGFWVALRLSKGPHTLHLQGALCDPDNEVVGFQQDYTYHLRIE